MDKVTLHGPLDPLYNQLPYILVDDWAGITEATLHSWYDTITKRFGANPFAHPNVTRRLNTSYWATLIRERRTTIPDTVAEPKSIWKQCDIGDLEMI